MPVELPFSQSSENNKAPIFQVLKRCFADRSAVLEIGSGTGQHAVHFAPQLPHLVWHTSDLRANHAGINAWLQQHPSTNLRAPVSLDVLGDVQAQLGVDFSIDAAFSANTAHIMSWPAVCAMFAALGELLPVQALFLLYGPFSDAGQHNSEGNRQFDEQLRAADSAMGIRDIEALLTLAKQHGFSLLEQQMMPANNRVLIWQQQ